MAKQQAKGKLAQGREEKYLDSALARAYTLAKTRTRPYDTAEYLETEEAMAFYLEAALEDGDARIVAAALGDIARAHGMTRIAKDTGLSRESLYKALSAEGNPELATVLKVVHSLGLKLQARAIGPVSPTLTATEHPGARKPRAHKLPSA